MNDASEREIISKYDFNSLSSQRKIIFSFQKQSFGFFFCTYLNSIISCSFHKWTLPRLIFRKKDKNESQKLIRFNGSFSIYIYNVEYLAIRLIVPDCVPKWKQLHNRKQFFHPLARFFLYLDLANNDSIIKK